MLRPVSPQPEPVQSLPDLAKQLPASPEPAWVQRAYSVELASERPELPRAVARPLVDWLAAQA